MWAPITNVLSILNEAKVNLLALTVAAAVVAIIIYGLKYKQGSDDEKVSATKGIKGVVYMTGGVNALIWLVSYIYTKMQ
ncbi:hypothetical protein [Brevibacillus agri]|uniref:hypothetical protein n=1 Tax=Brevibacillus agri TaxID=51101 RepID=UPI0018CCC2F7|nr:hypothetical protein [Brevibacillus agri]MBG9568422.1 hypothetical protein [Brevibacillus agri]